MKFECIGTVFDSTTQKWKFILETVKEPIVKFESGFIYASSEEAEEMGDTAADFYEDHGRLPQYAANRVV
jgi:hypothetical protein